MAGPAQTAQKENESIVLPILKLLLIVVALGALGFSLVMIDLPNKNYVWIAIEIVVAVLLAMAFVGKVKRIFGGR